MIIINDNSVESLLEIFRLRGGKINRYYLQAWNKNKQTTVYLQGWHRGRNVREALSKALGK